MIKAIFERLGRLLYSILAAIGRTVWTLVGPGLRFLSAVFLVAAVIALTMDVTRWQTGAVGPQFETLAAQIRAAAPATLDGIGDAVSAGLHPLLWDPVLITCLAAPAWIVLLAISLLLGYAARERRQVRIFIN